MKSTHLLYYSAAALAGAAPQIEKLARRKGWKAMPGRLL